MDMNKHDTEQILGQLGYAVIYRHNGWAECLVHGNNESWSGQGATEEDALANAIYKMFPSEGSFVALEHLHAAPLPAPELPAATDDVPQVGASAEEGSAEVAPVSPTVGAPAPVVEVQEAALLEEEPAVPEETIEKAAEVVVVEEPVPPPPPAPAVVSSTWVHPPTTESPPVAPEPKEEVAKLTQDEALEIVREISEEIDDEFDEFARMSTLYQRLHAAEWIFRARAVEEQFINNELVVEAVHQIARKLTGFCKVFWPGSVRGLQAYMSPAQSLDGLVKTRETVLKWEDAGKAVGAYLEELVDSPSRDIYGWGDFNQCRPEAPDPDAVLEEAVAKIEGVMGFFEEEPDRKKGICTKETISENIEELILAAHLLRWVRRDTTRSERWGRAIGLLRWASREGREEARPLRNVLADDHRPSMTWAAMLGRDPELKLKARLQREVMNQVPGPDTLEEDLMEWLVKAFTVLTNPQIAKVAAGVRDMILGFESEDFADADRNARSRLRKLQSLIRKGMDTSRVELPDAVEDEEGSPEEAPRPQKKSVDPAALLLKSVQKYTNGKRVLFVGNREDSKLQTELEKALGCKVTMKNCNTTREKAIVDGVTAHRFDLVLVATSFVGHGVSNGVARKAKAEGLPCVRVSKGRTAATVRALARAFNLSEHRKEADEAPVAATA